MTDDKEHINVSYTNWRGKTSVRRILPGELRFGVSEYHPEPTWLLNAFDLDHPAQIWKEFDLAKCDFVRDYSPARIEQLEARVAAADKLAELCNSFRAVLDSPVGQALAAYEATKEQSQ